MPAICHVVDACSPAPAVVAAAAQTIRAGGLVAFPTETVYGLGADGLNPVAVSHIFAAKGRPSTNPVILHVATVEQARQLVLDWPAAADLLAARFWPGPLTLVLPRRSNVPGVVTAGGPTVAVRMPAHPVAQALVAACGRPLAAPSANRSTRISATTAAHVAKELGDRIDMILDAGPTSAGLESTVLDLSEGISRILRPGPITAEQIAALVGPLEHASKPHKIARSPGQMPRHYAPSVPVELLRYEETACLAPETPAAHKIGWLSFGSVPAPAAATTIQIVMPPEPAGYAARLYAALHELEDAGVERIVVSAPPNTPCWAAVHDRLRRAASDHEEPITS
ncbi:MAG: threonylcarbamoyl-AMP synthase [Pirellulales bacterium]|nr:threonylcarbamoyl-AMP synthase [Pirellulales bacterium]